MVDEAENKGCGGVWELPRMRVGVVLRLMVGVALGLSVCGEVFSRTARRRRAWGRVTRRSYQRAAEGHGSTASHRREAKGRVTTTSPNSQELDH